MYNFILTLKKNVNMTKNGEIFDRRKEKNPKYKRTPYRILVKHEQFSGDIAPQGRVIAVSGKNYIVRDLGNDNAEIELAPAGTIRTPHKNSTLIAVGDYVNFTLADNENDNFGTITYVHERQTWLSRKPLKGIREDVIATNADMLLIIASADSPPYNKRNIDRLIVAAKIGNLEPAICINKIDLFDDPLMHEDLEVYSSLGYPLLFISALKKQGLDVLHNLIKEKELIFAGPSGVGKSTIINTLFGRNVQKVKEISLKTSKGRHTTSFARLMQLDSDTSIIDTPGFREFGLTNITKQELGLYFDDFLPYYEHCKFMPCSHTHEPDCAVKLAVTKGEIDYERYESYINIYNTIE